MPLGSQKPCEKDELSEVIGSGPDTAVLSGPLVLKGSISAARIGAVKSSVRALMP